MKLAWEILNVFAMYWMGFWWVLYPFPCDVLAVYLLGTPALAPSVMSVPRCSREYLSRGPTLSTHAKVVRHLFIFARREKHWRDRLSHMSSLPGDVGQRTREGLRKKNHKIRLNSHQILQVQEDVF